MASPASDVAEASGHPQTAPWSALFSGGNAWRAIALTGGVALHAINVHIVTTILPSVVKDIGGLDYYAWNVTLFVATSILGSTLTNKLLALFGPRKAYLFALLVFGAGALACASAGDMAWMLAGRSVQGIGGGLLASLSYALIPIVFPQRLWSRAIALVSGMWGIATLLGPAVGGLFAAGGHWRWAFWALLPILLVQAVIVIAQLKGRDARHENPRMPLLRILLLGASVLLVASAGQVSDGWLKLACLGGGALLGLWVARMDLRQTLSLLPRNGYRLGTEMGKVFACISLLVIGSCTEIFVPYFLQTLHGYAPLAAGYMTAAMAGGWSAASLFSSGRSGVEADRMVRLGPMLMTAGLVVLALLLPAQFDAPEIVIDGLLMLALAAAGMGIGMGWPHLISRALHAAELGEENLTSSAVTTVQLYAMAIGAALVGVVANEAGVAREGGEAHAALILFALFAVVPLLAVWLAQRLTCRH